MTVATLLMVVLAQAPAGPTTISGRVVGLGGGPVAEATVFQSGGSPARAEGVADRDGRFQLSGFVARPTFLFVRKAGYRFGGVAIAAESKDITLTIHKADEPPRLTRKTVPPLLPREEEIALARRLLDPYAELVLKSGGEAEKIRTLEALARIEPGRVVELLSEKKVFTQPFYNGMLGLRVASGLMEQSVDEALAVLEGLEDPGAKAMGYIKASTRLAGKDRAKALAVLDRALLNARAAKEPEAINLLLMGQVAERFLDLGQAERGRTILREGEALAKQLPKEGWVGYARGAFAEELVQVDLEAGLALTKDLADPREFDRHHGNIAQELGGRDPAQAERVLGMVKDAFQRDLYTVRVVYRMGSLDLPRARRLAEAMSDQVLKGYALGTMALGLAEAGKDSAQAVLTSAFELLERLPLGTAAKPASYYRPALVAAVLLPVAERIDPKLVDEYLWRSLAMRLPKPSEPDPSGRTTEAEVQLATAMARYDRTIARSLIEPLVQGDGAVRAYLSRRGELYAAAVAIDPKWAVAVVEKLPDDPDTKMQHPKNFARLVVASVLGRVGDERFRHLQYQYLRLWLPDVEDYDADN